MCPTVDIINVVSVTSQAAVNHWLEENDAEIQENLYWRQALDVRTMELSVCYFTIMWTSLSLACADQFPLLAVPDAYLQVQPTGEPGRGSHWL